MDWKKLGKWLLFPHPVIAGLLLPLSLGMMLWGVLHHGPDAPLTIAAYALSFYGLVLVCLRIPAVLRAVQRFRQENKYYLLYKNDVQLRVNISLYGAFGFNAVYAAFQLGLGLWHHSAFFYAMAGYYLLLALMRLTLVRHTRRHIPGEDAAVEWRKYRFCGALLLMMNIALLIFALYFIYQIRDFRHHEITTIVMATYTFTALTVAIVNAIRYRKYGSPAYSAAKAISLVSATVSMLTLENAMLTTFGDSGLLRQILLSASSVAVICVVQGIALYMITNANKKLRINKT